MPPIGARLGAGLVVPNEGDSARGGRVSWAEQQGQALAGAWGLIPQCPLCLRNPVRHHDHGAGWQSDHRIQAEQLAS